MTDKMRPPGFEPGTHSPAVDCYPQASRVRFVTGEGKTWWCYPEASAKPSPETVIPASFRRRLKVSERGEYIERDRKAVLAAAGAVYGSAAWEKLNRAIQDFEWQVAHAEREKVGAALAAIGVRPPPD